MDVKQITNRALLAAYFRQDAPLHLYSLGDLDDFYWPRCTYYATVSNGALGNVCLVYRGEGLPILLALGPVKAEFLRRLFGQLPGEFYAHLSPGLEDIFRPVYQIKEYGPHYKMFLEDFSRIHPSGAEGADPVTPNELSAISQLYKESYPDNAFDPRMLESGQYFGLRVRGKLVSVAGVHVYSPGYGVAALGNITTHPDFRGRGFGRTVTTRLCLELSKKVPLIGLNVNADNQAAISLYKGLGFRISDEYGEFSLQTRF